MKITSRSWAIRACVPALLGAFLCTPALGDSLTLELAKNTYYLFEPIRVNVTLQLEKPFVIVRDDPLTSEGVSQSNLTFSRNVENQSGVYAIIDGSKDINSSAEYWVTHVVSAYQGYPSRDGDSDSEETNPGLLYGLTKATFFSRGGSLICLESCRDKARAQPFIDNLVFFTVAHEVGHQFGLEHPDGDENPAGSGTFLMRSSPNSIFPSHLWFSAISLNKIRNIPFPQY